jgi:hypothetical protein
MPEGGQGTTYNGRRAFLCSVWDTAYNVTSPVNDVVAITSSWSYNDRMDSGWVLRAPQAVSATSAAASTNSVDTTTTSSNGYVMHLHVTANNRDAGSITVKLFDSLDNSTFAQVTGATFTVVNFGVTSSERIFSNTQTVRRYIAADITVTGGTTGSYTITMSAAKRA